MASPVIQCLLYQRASDIEARAMAAMVIHCGMNIQVYLM